ncbi:MAG: ABC transporter permease subunit [Oscillospiraceae bacterium]|jgi:NitT/TauT family transport system permease protein|nr:ABC transporter permease subunit [Oscillospiraceae bacterium]
MTARQRFLKTANALFVLFLLIQFLPDRISKDSAVVYSIVFGCALEAILLIVSATAKSRQKLNVFADIISVIYIVLIAWTLASAKFNILREMLFPPPGVVFKQFIEDTLGEKHQVLTHVGSSLALIVNGYLLGIIFAVPLGLLFGYSVRAGNAATYISKFLASIPPVVYIPYGIALLPTFRSVSVMVIFLATFWPVFAGTIAGVLYTERKYIDAAQVFGSGKLRILFTVVLPGALPQIFTGCNQGLSVSFILLTSAEMIGARSGMGYYVKNYSDLGNYTRTIVGVLLIGVVISAVFALFNKLQKRLLRWKV